MPGRGGTYLSDVAALAAWSPSLVISMVETAEFDQKQTGQLGADLSTAGIAWLHVPTRDFDVPAQLDWPDMRDRVLARLQAGDKVLVHCMGGCGRSGMIALRVMIASGEDPDAALARLRGIRPCAIETEAQMAWATQSSLTP